MMPSACSSVWVPIALTARAPTGACAAALGACGQPSTPRLLSSSSLARPPTEPRLHRRRRRPRGAEGRGAAARERGHAARTAGQRPECRKRSPSLRALVRLGFTSITSRKPFLTTSLCAAAPRLVTARASPAPDVSRAAPLSILGAALAVQSRR
ncbi:unnamed protein product [Prorocentrum cordatum]|uniref:Uncharacterized protein n=1 Tax=Prorocentrum cordatum TaxID=2364126 RepID=A0ABN9W899_9DINO|nr:unnamed protein product [Polarella glacialis]